MCNIVGKKIDQYRNKENGCAGKYEENYRRCRNKEQI